MPSQRLVIKLSSSYTFLTHGRLSSAAASHRFARWLGPLFPANESSTKTCWIVRRFSAASIASPCNCWLSSAMYLPTTANDFQNQFFLDQKDVEQASDHLLQALQLTLLSQDGAWWVDVYLWRHSYTLYNFPVWSLSFHRPVRQLHLPFHA